MIIKDTQFEGVKIINPYKQMDNRGVFKVTYNERDFEADGIKNNFIQDNMSISNAGVFRGFHLQRSMPQSKLVSVMLGKALDVIIDLRKNSDTYLQYGSFIIGQGEEVESLLIPRGFAHGFLSIEDDTIFSYKVDNHYNPADEDGISLYDPDLKDIIGLDFNALLNNLSLRSDLIITSDKDKEYKPLKENLKNITYYG